MVQNGIDTVGLWHAWVAIDFYQEVDGTVVLMVGSSVP